MKSCGCQTSTPTLRRIEKSLAVSGDMRMLGREREDNGVSYFSHLCTFGALISINVMNFALICKDRTAISLNLCKIQEFPRLES